MSMRRVFAVTLLATAPLVAGCDDDGDDINEPELPNIVEVAEEAGSFTVLLTALSEAGLAGTLAQEGPFTVFAPTDAAFDRIPDEDLNAILADQELLSSILTFHVLPGRLSAADVTSRSSLTTLNGETLSVEVEGGTVTVEGATVTATDIEAENGVVHVIDRVLVPGS